MSTLPARRRRATLRGRVSALTVAVLAVWLIIVASGFDLFLFSRLSSQINDALRVRAQSASATLVITRGRVTAVRDSPTDSELDSSIWVYSQGAAIDHPNESADLSVAAAALAAAGTGYSERLRHRFYVLPIRARGERIGSIVAAIDLAGYDRTRDTAIAGTVVVTVLLLAGTYPALLFATGRALRPVDVMTRQAPDWSVNAPTQRFGTRQQYTELASLAASLDELLDRLSAVLRHERHVSAELSHELRTPLTRISGEVDLMLSTARDDQRQSLAAMRAGCRAMDTIMDSLMAAARREYGGPVGRTELAALFAGLDTTGKPPRVAATATALSVGVDPDLVMRMLGPVIDNAMRYASQEIRVSARREGSRIAIDISNDGPRIAPEHTERVFDPGYRGDRSDGHDGAGLGLALARRLARSADGDLLLRTATAGTTFSVLLPPG